MYTFPLVCPKEAKYGDRTKRAILELYDHMSKVIDANEVVHAANRLA